MELGLLQNESSLDGVHEGLELLRDEDAERAMGHLVNDDQHQAFGDVSDEPHAMAGRVSLGHHHQEPGPVAHHPVLDITDSLLADQPPPKRQKRSRNSSSSNNNNNNANVFDMGVVQDGAGPLSASTAQDGDTTKGYRCTSCGSNFSTRHMLSRHLRTVHERDMQWDCDICHSSFLARGSLLTHHKIVHEGKKEYQCTHCPRAFGLKGNLRRHVKEVHLKKRDFGCDSCGRTFAQKGDLDRHIKTLHQGQRNFKCPSCTKAFGHKGDLNRHITTVHQSRKTYHCDMCTTSFGEKGHLNRHKRTVHQKEDSNGGQPSDVDNQLLLSLEESNPTTDPQVPANMSRPTDSNGHTSNVTVNGPPSSLSAFQVPASMSRETEPNGSTHVNIHPSSSTAFQRLGNTGSLRGDSSPPPDLLHAIIDAEPNVSAHSAHTSNAVSNSELMNPGGHSYDDSGTHTDSIHHGYGDLTDVHRYGDLMDNGGFADSHNVLGSSHTVNEPEGGYQSLLTTLAEAFQEDQEGVADNTTAPNNDASQRKND